MTNLTARTTHDLPAALPSNIPSIETALLTPAQGIQCGSLNVAFSFAWARSIVEDFSLTPIPNAPAWLLGAANIEGEIVPVFDLVLWVGAGASGLPSNAPGAGRTRLLVGGHGDKRAAIIFSGSARMVRYAAGSQKRPAGPALPPRLNAVVLAGSETTPPHWVLDAPKLLDHLAGDPHQAPWRRSPPDDAPAARTDRSGGMSTRR
jgi:chemotaxis signal transduction protein